MENILVPIAFFATIPLTVWAVTSFRHKSRARLADMVQAMAASGNPVSEDMIKSLSVNHKKPHNDLRWGLIWIAIGLGTVFFAGAIPEEEGTAMVAAIASFPILIGLVLVAFWALISRKVAD